jgi:hypothetical protein
MPTISQLPVTNVVSAADEIPISQDGATRAVPVGTLLASTQPAIIVDSPALIGRKSIGPGGPEQIDLGVGVDMMDGKLIATGSDHSAFPIATSLPPNSDLVISAQGNPMLLQSSLLRGLFTAGQNVIIDSDGVISVTSAGGVIAANAAATAINVLPRVDSVGSQDLISISNSGKNCAVTYSQFLNGLTIDQVDVAAFVQDSDLVLASQGDNSIVGLSFGNIRRWIENKSVADQVAVVEISSDCVLDASIHDGKILVCSQPINISPFTTDVKGDLRCTIINVSSDNITFDPGFVSSNGSLTLSPLQSASLLCLNYSAGTMQLLSMQGNSVTSSSPAQVIGLAAASVGMTYVNLIWQASPARYSVSRYIVQYRVSGTSGWSSCQFDAPLISGQISGLVANTNYDFFIQSENLAGMSPPSQILTALTSAIDQTAIAVVPSQVGGLTATSISSSSVGLTWLGQIGANAANSFTVQFRPSGSQNWTVFTNGISGTSVTVAGLQAGTSYDFSVFGMNAVGNGLLSSIITAATSGSSQSVISVIWNLIPSGSYVRSSGAIGVNAHITPATAAVQFGFSLSTSSPPVTWTNGVLVNTDLWGAYIPTPSSPGSWYAWVRGLDGSCLSYNLSQFVVQ